jgi:hypothetical protein
MSNTSDAIADHDTYSKNLPAIVGVFESNTSIADAMGYSALPSDIRSDLWDMFETASGLGYVPTIDNPRTITTPHLYNLGVDWNPTTNTLDGGGSLASGVGTQGEAHTCNTTGSTNLDGNTSWYPGNVAVFFDGQWWRNQDLARQSLTRAQSSEIYAATVAHSFLLDINNAVPWRLATYTLEECVALFEPDSIFFAFHDGSVDWDDANFENAILHDPEEIKAEAETICGTPLTTHKAAIKNLCNWFHGQWIHGASGQTGVALTASEFFDTGEINVSGNYKTTSNAFVSRAGCHTSGPLFPGLLRSLNIPARYVFGVFDNEGHDHVEFPSIWARQISVGSAYTADQVGAVMSHADNLHNSLMDVDLGTLFLEPKGAWDTLVPGDPKTYSNQILGRRLLLYPEGALTYFINQGWGDIEAALQNYLVESDWSLLTAYHNALIERNRGADVA